ncbi:DUF4328 domain-containing protein [Saccharopolyspora phatthalungensis]|uniref:DUF4328 domain-containing protein n=1 Tax=Saccharopolyspora phatthalungensis TaxID=664693 RepID=A0A840Q2Q1_9PSEU|nr:DUF4328 domain-containing protein [Saccharopolyspora phatthalungensis]MBB5154210.1 hypothetical protein [Saccharopolyspora phatthalungensis]
MEWIATPPGGPRRIRPPRRPRRYTGPPAYPAVPRWGFPLLAWRWPLALPLRAHADPMARAESTAGTAVATLWITAVVAALATFAEGWRYVLLLISRSHALPRTPLAISDALVSTTGMILWVLGVLCGVLVVVWGLRARAAAAARIGVRNARPDWQVVVGVLVPGLNLFVPGSVLAELEHSVLVAEGARKRGVRPFPTLRVRLWWAVWGATLLLGWLVFGWGLRGSVQALADGVVLHALNNALVTVLAVQTVMVIKYLMRLLAPLDPTELKHLRVRAVHAAPPPPRAARPTTAPR